MTHALPETLISEDTSANAVTLRKDHDTPWKNMVHTYFEECMTFFFPAVATAIDWSVPPQFRDAELQKIVVEGDTGRRIVDVLAEVHLHTGLKTAILLHLEIQGDRVADFPERLFIYYARIFDRYRLPVITLAILTDKDPSWCPAVYEFKALGFEHRMVFPVAKLLDYQDHDKQADLERSENPFALVVLARLAAIRTQKNHAAGLEAKITLTRHLYTLAKKQGKSNEFVRNLFNMIDFILALPRPRALEYQQVLHQIEQEMKMPYLSSIEQLAQQQGITLGINQGMQQGMELGSRKTQHRIAYNLLQRGVDPSEIANVTGMSIQELASLMH